MAGGADDNRHLMAQGVVQDPFNGGVVGEVNDGIGIGFSQLLKIPGYAVLAVQTHLPDKAFPQGSA